MKKIMFNDQYGLTQAVLDGRKTMTRRIVPLKLINEFGHNKFSDRSYELIQHAQYQVGEVVAIAQSYKDCGNTILEKWGHSTDIALLGLKKLAGWNNKMFVKADLMPHHIRITNIRVERLQDISDEDCLREGIMTSQTGKVYYTRENGTIKATFESPIFAFQYLIDKVSGKGTWENNPYVFVYDFELVD